MIHIPEYHKLKMVVRELLRNPDTPMTAHAIGRKLGYCDGRPIQRALDILYAHGDVGFERIPGKDNRRKFYYPSTNLILNKGVHDDIPF